MFKVYYRCIYGLGGLKIKFDIEYIEYKNLKCYWIFFLKIKNRKLEKNLYI